MRLPTITEIHSSELSSNCPKRILCKHLGLTDRTSPTAMYRGSLANAALVDLHETRNWTSEGVRQAIIAGERFTQVRTVEEGRELTEACARNQADIIKECDRVLSAYASRLGPIFERLTPIGTEIPIRLDLGHLLDSEEQPIEFASHLDLLVRDNNNALGFGAGRLICLDWKWTDTSPTKHYLSRWPQGMMYALMLRYGQVQIGSENAGEEGTWVRMDEWPEIGMIHLPSLKPYGRKTSRTVNGNVVEFKRGDDRPMQAIMLWCGYREDRALDMLQRLVEPVRMMQHGLFPAIPDPIGCSFCSSQEFCSRFDMEASGHDVL